MDSQTAYLFNKNYCNNINFGDNYVDKFGFTINYNKNVLQWMDHEIPLQNPDAFFNNNMFIDLNNNLCLQKEDNMFDQILDVKYEQLT